MPLLTMAVHAEPPRASLEDLPAETIALVLTMLMRVDPITLIFYAPCVCRRWRAVCRDHIPLESELPPRYFATIAKRFRWVQQVTLSPTAEELHLLGRLPNKPYLKSLCLQIVDADFPWEIIAGFAGVTRICCQFCSRLSDDAIAALVLGCKRLKHLEISHCFDINPRNIDKITAFTCLEHLDLGDCGAFENSSLAMIAARCKALKHLNLYQSINITDVCALAAGCPRLEYLNLFRCYNITEGSVAALAGCKHLRHLILTDGLGVTDYAVAAIAGGCKDLQNLDLSKCDKITDVAIRALAAGCKDLQSLELFMCYKITDVAVSAVAAGCKDLQSLGLPD